MSDDKTVNSRFVGNTNYTQVEPLLTVEKLKNTYLFGTLHFPDSNGKELTDDDIQTFINNAISMLEMALDIAVMPRKKREYKDYFLNDYYEWGYMKLNNYPVIDIESIDMVYNKSQPNGDDFDAVVEIPKQWIRLDPDTGIVRLIPSNRFPSQLQIGANGSFFPDIFRRNSHVPHMWRINYTHGFREGCVPSALNAAIGLIASIFVMNILGDLIQGAGIAGTSISLDGLSQSIQTTASAENHGFSAKVKDYARQLFGDKSLGAKGIVEILKDYFKGQSIDII